MKLSQFKFKLPEEAIALNPPYHRDECRLMVLHRLSQNVDLTETDDSGVPLHHTEVHPESHDCRNLRAYF